MTCVKLSSGRVVSNFVTKALKGEDLVIFGDGQQSRSLQYVHDLVDALILLVRFLIFVHGGSVGNRLLNAWAIYLPQMNTQSQSCIDAPTNLGTNEVGSRLACAVAGVPARLTP